MNKVQKASIALGIMPNGIVWNCGRDHIVYDNGRWIPYPYMFQGGGDVKVENVEHYDGVIQEIVTKHYLYYLTLPWYVRFVRRLWYRSYSTLDSKESHFIVHPL